MPQLLIPSIGRAAPAQRVEKAEGGAPAVRNMGIAAPPTITAPREHDRHVPGRAALLHLVAAACRDAHSSGRDSLRWRKRAGGGNQSNKEAAPM